MASGARILFLQVCKGNSTILSHTEQVTKVKVIHDTMMSTTNKGPCNTKENVMSYISNATSMLVWMLFKLFNTPKYIQYNEAHFIVMHTCNSK